MAGEFYNNKLSTGEVFSTATLMQYLRDQFEDAYRKDSSEDERGEIARHGRFHREVVLPGDYIAPAGSWQIVMKPPHPKDTEGDRAEIFAIALQGTDGHLVADDSGLFADQFIVHIVNKFKSDGYWLITDDGVFSTNIDDFDEKSGFDKDAHDQLFAAIDRAEYFYEKLSRYNIVASSDLKY